MVCLQGIHSRKRTHRISNTIWLVTCLPSIRSRYVLLLIWRTFATLLSSTMRLSTLAFYQEWHPQLVSTF